MNSRPRFNTLADWLAWQETSHPRAIDLGLNRVAAVAARLDAQLNGALLHNAAKRVLVAGTNGKGSTLATLSALLQAQGLKVGLYTSPHLLHYNERVRLQGQTASSAQLCAAFAAIDAARGDISLSFFEWGTLAALWVFAQQPLDVWLLEVGLGGRLDAVNILDADIAVITSIALDHQDWLGHSRSAISLEKAGICRSGKPVVLACPEPPQALLQHIQQLNCPLYALGSAFHCQPTTQGTALQLGLNWHLTLPPFALQLPAPSVAAALQVAALLNALPRPEEAAPLLSQTRLAGRLQRLPHPQVELLLDVAHNPASTAYLAQQLAARPAKPCALVMAMMADKDLAGSLAPLVALNAPIYCASLPDNPRAATAEHLQSVALSLGAKAFACQSVASALDAAIAQLPAQGRLVVCGSFFTLSAAYTALGLTLDGHPQTEVQHG